MISHLLGDHLHVRSLRKISHRTPIVVPRGALRAVRALRLLRSFELVEISAGECVQVGAVRVRAVPAQHDSRRHDLARLGSAPPLGFVIEGAHRTYFAGDTGLYPEMADEVGRCDVALLPVGGWGPGLGPHHLNSRTAAEALQQLGAPNAVPIHFGTLWPVGLDRVRPAEFFSPGADFVDATARSTPRARVHLLAPARPGGRPRDRLAAAQTAADSGAAAASMETTVRTVTYLALFAGVAVGAIVPIIPTGALVSTAAVTSLHSPHPWTALLVIGIGAVAALIGDMVLFWLCSLPVGHRLLGWLRGRTSPALLERYHRQLDEHGLGVLILSRLIPAGRIPIMVATLVLGVTWRWYLAGDAVAALAWAVTYAAIGVLSGSLFDEQWKGIVLAIAVVLLVSVGPSLVRALRRRLAVARRESPT